MDNRRQGSHKFVTYAINDDIKSMNRMIKKGYVPFDEHFDCIYYYLDERKAESHKLNVLKNLERFYQGDYSSNYNFTKFNWDKTSDEVLKYLYKKFALNSDENNILLPPFHTSNNNFFDFKKYYIGYLSEDIKNTVLRKLIGDMVRIYILVGEEEVLTLFSIVNEYDFYTQNADESIISSVIYFICVRFPYITNDPTTELLSRYEETLNRVPTNILQKELDKLNGIDLHGFKLTFDLLLNIISSRRSNTINSVLKGD